MITDKYVWQCKECGFTKETAYIPRKDCPVCKKRVEWRGLRKVITKGE